MHAMHTATTEPPLMVSMQLASENNITGTGWRYGLPPPDLQEYLESIKTTEDSSGDTGDIGAAGKSSGDSQDSPSVQDASTPTKHRFRGALAAMGGALGGMVGAATAAVRHIPRPPSPRGHGEAAESTSEMEADVHHHVVDMHGADALGSTVQSAGSNVSVGRYDSARVLFSLSESFVVHVVQPDHWMLHSTTLTRPAYLAHTSIPIHAVPTHRSISLRSIALAPGSSMSESVDHNDMDAAGSLRLDPVLELDSSRQPSSTAPPPPPHLTQPPPFGDSNDSSRQGSAAMRPLDSANSTFAALARRVEQEQSLIHSSGSGGGGANGVRGLIISYKDSGSGVGAKKASAGSTGVSGPSWTSSEASSFTVGLEQLNEKLRSRPSNSSGSLVAPEEGAARHKARQRMKRKLRRSNSLPMPETAAIPEIMAMSGSSGEDD